MFNVTVIRRRCTSSNTHLQGGHDTVVSAPGTLGRSLVPLGRSLQEERGRQASEYGGMLRHEGSSHVHTAGQTHRYCRRIQHPDGDVESLGPDPRSSSVGRARRRAWLLLSQRRKVPPRQHAYILFLHSILYTSSAAALQTQTQTHTHTHCVNIILYIIIIIVLIYIRIYYIRFVFWRNNNAHTRGRI